MKKLSFGTAVSAVIACTIALTLAACGGDTTVSPTRDSATPAVASAPAPTAPAPNPSPTPGAVEEGPGYEIEFEDNAGFKVKNQTDIGQAYRAYTTSFDNLELETAHKLSGTVPSGETWGDSFNGSCLQLDITQFGYAGLPLKGGATWYDKNGKQFNPSRNPEKITECRNRCVEEWLEIENEPEVSYGEWSACGPSQVEDDSIGEETQSACSKKRTVTITYTEQNTCTNAKRKGRVIKREETAPCESYQVGAFTVQADQHVGGSYNYRVCTEINNILGYKTCKTSSVVWTGSLPQNGSSGPIDYPVNGKTLYVQVDIGPVWEGISESTTASCPDLKLAWNEDISFACSLTCKSPQ